MGLSPHTGCTLFAACLALALPRAAVGAEVTRVATAFEADAPFGLNLDVGFSRTWRQGTILRENHQLDASKNPVTVDVVELRYTRQTNQLPMRAAFGVYHDIELHVGTSLVLSDNQSWGYASGTTDATSTIYNNVINPRCTSSPTESCAPLASAQPIFKVPGASYRAGLGDFALGISWALFNDQKDDTKAKWVISFDYQIPTAAAANPSQNTTPGSTGGIGDKVHRFNFSTAISKRLGPVDPYVRFSYSLPTQAPGYWNNCNPGGAALGYPENCGVGQWTPQETGIKPPHVAGLVFGAEFYPYDEPAKHQRVGVDLQLGGLWISQGRTYNELSDALGKLLYTDEYLTVGGQVGIYARAAQYVQLRLNASLYRDTDHFLTNEPIGSCSGSAPGGGPCNISVGGANKDISPNFDFRYDQPGRRFLISQSMVYSVMATGTLSF
jgi:hypothetical protein